MRILMLTSLPANLDSIKGGVDAVIVNLMNGFELFPDSHLMILSLAKSDHRKTVHHAQNITIEYLPRNRAFGGNLFDFLFYSRKIVREIIQKYKPDVIHVQGATPVLFCLRGLNRDNIVITQHGIMEEEIKYQKGVLRKLKFFIKKIVERYYFPAFKNYIFISRYNQRFLERIKRKADYKSALIFNPVNPAFFNVKPHRKFLKRIMYVGVINRRKNLLSLLHGLRLIKARVQGIKVDVVGGFRDASYQAEILQFIEINGMQNQVQFRGWKDQDEVLELYKKSDVFVLPSLQESLPVSIAEAMAAGRPVIASDVGGVAEMFTNEKSGFTFESNNIDELKGCLLKFCNGDTVYAELAENARLEAISKFHPKSVVKQTLDFYRRMLKN
ncbi:MAG: glycosyltransferase family 4 protein [Marinifilaceae bacterium]